MRHYLLLLFIGFSFCFTSCREDFEFEHSSGGLEFSRDTVYLDTVFTNIGSSTYTLKVYNRSDKDIKIPSIHLGDGEQSKYRLMVDGKPGKIFSDVELLAKDSMFVFIETTIDYNEYANNETTFLYNDKIYFGTGTNEQKVELVTLVQDAVFLYPQRNDAGEYESIPISDTDNTQVYGFNLNEAEHNNEFIWTNTKPYVIYGNAAVPTGKTLTVNPGARIHFHDSSSLIVRNGASLVVGTESGVPSEENQVIFEGDRLEPEFSDVPGQWLTVWLQPGSTGNSLNNIIIRNATIGILMEGNDNTPETLKLKNTQIYNCTNFGLLSRNGSIYGENVVMNNAGQASLALTQGGTYSFRHSTFANYFGGFNQVPVVLNDYQETPDTIILSDLDARFDNCILYGSSNLGVSLERYKLPAEGSPVQVLFKCAFNNCLIKVIDTSRQLRNNPLYPPGTSDVNNPDLVSYNTGCVIAKSSTADRPFFENPQDNKLNISDDSAANSKADPAIAATVPNDITGAVRNLSTPDIGAYESGTFEEE